MNTSKSKEIDDLFSEIYLSFTDTFNYIKLVWITTN